MASQLGLVARHNHPHLDDVLLRLQQCYTGNYRYLDLLRQVNHAALREAGIDADLMRDHPFSWALSAEIEELKREAREARKQLAATPHVVSSLLVTMRRKLSPTPLGRAWRLAQQVRSKLSPTPLGRAYRLAKRGARACRTWGR